MKKQYTIALVIIIVAAVLAGAGYLHQKQIEQDITDKATIGTLITQFGANMQKVSLSAPDAPAEIASTYAAYATSDLIKQWQDNRSFAPGRGLSSPWPDRIEVQSLTKHNSSVYTVEGTVVEITSKEVAQGGIAATFPVSLTIEKINGQWLISDYQPGPVQTYANSTTTAPATNTAGTTTTRKK